MRSMDVIVIDWHNLAEGVQLDIFGLFLVELALSP